MPDPSSRFRATRTCAIAALTLGIAVSVADARLPQQDGAVALPSQANTIIAGAGGPTGSDPLGDRAGEAVAPAGDMNRDGFADVIVGAKGFNGSSFNFGAAYVVFGSPNEGAALNLSGLGSNGFRITGESDADFAGAAVAGGGDVNGDGISDVVVGAGNAGPNGASPGSAYVVFGKSTSTPVDLTTLAATGQGFEIVGAAVDDLAGFSVAITGDMTGDGRSEVVVGAPSVGADDGAAYAVFGKASSAQVSLSALGGAGFQMTGPPGSSAGRSVSGSGDVNADGRADLVVGAPGAFASAGAAYVVFGRTATTPLPLGSLSSAEGYTIGTPPPTAEGVGESVASVGDLSGEGRPDFAIGGSGEADPPGRTNAGAAYAVFSPFPPTNVDLANLDPRGFRVIGASNDFAGRRVGGAGDFNGNGVGDVMVSASCADVGGLIDAGKAYIIDGSPVQQADAAALGSRGVTINGGFAEGDACPDNGDPEVSVAGAGDFNGDGRPDAIVGMSRNDNNGSNAGAAYIIYGYGAPRVSYASGSSVLTDQGVVVAPSVIRRTGAFSFSISPALPPGLSFNPSTGVITGSAPRSSPLRTYTVTLTDRAGAAAATLPISISSPDNDGDGVTVEDGDCLDDPARGGARRSPKKREIPNNGVDENCNGIRGFDRDRDGALAKPEGRDCRDRDKRVRPGKRDVPGNNLNEDCRGGKRPGRLRSTLDQSWGFSRSRGTRARRLILERLAGGVTVMVECRGDGCPSRDRRVKLKRAKKRLNLVRRFSGRLKPGARVTVSLSKPNNAGKVFVVRIRGTGLPPCLVVKPRRVRCTTDRDRRGRASATSVERLWRGW